MLSIPMSCFTKLAQSGPFHSTSWPVSGGRQRRRHLTIGMGVSNFYTHYRAVAQELTTAWARPRELGKYRRQQGGQHKVQLASDTAKRLSVARSVCPRCVMVMPLQRIYATERGWSQNSDPTSIRKDTVFGRTSQGLTGCADQSP
jgi:hypothetical protein